MESNWTDLLPVYGVEDGCILSRQGDFTVAFRVHKPEIFQLSGDEYETLHQSWVRAIKVLPVGTVIHQQDWYTQVSYRADLEGEGPEKSWLGQASERFFNERPWLDHSADLFLTLRPRSRRKATSAMSGLLYPDLPPQASLDDGAIAEFLGQCGQMAHILEDSGLLRLERLGEEELWSAKGRIGRIERYCNLNTGGTPMLADIEWKQGLRIGENHCQLFALADAEHLPPLCGPRINHDPYSSEHTKYSIGFATGLGPLLPCNHITNLYIIVEDNAATMKRLEVRSRQLGSLAKHSRGNAASEEATTQFLQEAATRQWTPVRAHLNILCWTTEAAELPRMKNLVSTAIARMGASPRVESVGALPIWWAGIPGNAAELPMNETFDIFAEQAACLMQQETNYRTSTSPFGLRLGDRITGRPLHVDIDDEPRAKGLTANGNMVVISGSGGGKSFFTNHLLRHYYEQGVHIVVVDVGHSYEMQCELHGGYYFTYEEDNPIRFNPFFLGPGETLDTEKRESIKTLLVALWKRQDESPNRSEYVALSTALQLYFEKLEKEEGLFPCFDTFYEFLNTEYRKKLKSENIKEKEFDLANFLYVLRPYYKNGEFDYLLNARENLDLLQQRFIVFELDNIKSHPILFPVVTLIIMELFVSKMRKLKGVRKAIIIEEAWKAIAQEGMAEYLKYLFKTVRKFHAKAVVVTQEVEDVISSEIVKNAIINNADIKILLDQSKFQNKFDAIQELLGITAKQKAEVLSINKAHEAGSRYKDLWICLGATHSRVYRLEVSPQEYFVYTSDQKEKLQVRESIRKYGSVQKGIRMLVEALGKNRITGAAGKALIFLGLLLLPALSQAQDPTSIISEGIKTVIRAFDLVIQREQTATILLQDAQKVVENELSETKLAEIGDWVANLKALYAEYFEELREVKTAVAEYHAITEIIQRQEQILALYRQATAKVYQDPHFTPTEVSHAATVYSGVLGESTRVLEGLQFVVQSFTLQLSDEQRLALINHARTQMDKLYRDLRTFTDQNALLSLQRGGAQKDIQSLLKLYGL
ncbi:MAG TPA: TraG family conjugative transposon ATPase [Puia sp.]|uniref:TraG family conjugative transposon ATPase n=1 Tax=Puia sp. TaxID=2045100 RepID=UPI002C9C2347|nr:TraG family conjugative transposon ATPase [Puia sp.]HVU97990.1 TraG family conjugative transposon ATPase [Puia sp.]